ncbi:MAG: hypothetical protein K2M03_02960 [Muribaculaceae bacterium]|nr:hypothetical protein [Muribaculaceae bacterium]
MHTYLISFVRPFACRVAGAVCMLLLPTSAGAQTTSFFDRKLTLHLQGSYIYKNESLTRTDMHTFSWSVDASYTLGNVRLALNYRSPMKSLSNGGRQTTRISGHIDASLTSPLY